MVTVPFVQPGVAQGLNRGTVTTDSLRVMPFCPRRSGSGLLLPPVIDNGDPTVQAGTGALLQNSSCPRLRPATEAWIKHRAASSFVMCGDDAPLPGCTFRTLNIG